MTQYYLISGLDNNKVNKATNTSLKTKVTDEGIMLLKEQVDSSDVSELVKSFNPVIVDIPTDPSGSV